jgi:hypothetical protein
MYLNHNPSPWVVNLGGTVYTIPEDGFVARIPSTQFVAFSAIAPSTGGARIDYCYAPGQYEFFDGRGAVNGYGNIDTGGLKRLKFKNFVHNVTGWETSGGGIQTSNGPAPNVTNVAIRSTNTSFGVGDRQGVKAIAFFDNGAFLNVTSLVDWSSSNDAVARINEGAALTAVAPGQAAITTSAYGGKLAPPMTVQVH